MSLDYANYFQCTGDSDYLFSSFFIAMIAYIMPIFIGNCRLSSNNLKIIASLIAQGNFLAMQLLLINFAFRSFVFYCVSINRCVLRIVTLTIPYTKDCVIDVQNKAHLHFMSDMFQWARFRNGLYMWQHFTSSSSSYIISLYWFTGEILKHITNMNQENADIM